MTIKETLKKAPANITKAASTLQNNVRECEEISRGQFSAFVDDGKESYDVGIQLDESGLQLNHYSCDCSDKNTLCAHVVAVLTFMNRGEKSAATSTTIKKLRKKKLSPTEELLDNVDNFQLRTWILEELNLNKELNLKFFNHFSSPTGKISAEEINNQGAACIQAVIGKKKYIEPVQLKALFEVWQKYLDTQMPAILNELGNEQGMLMVDAIFGFYGLIDSKVKKSSSRIGTQFNKFVEKLSAYLQTCEEEKVFSFLQQFTLRLKQNGKGLNIVLNLIYKTAPVLTKEAHASLLKLYLNNVSKNDLTEPELMQLLLYVIQHDLFTELHSDLPYTLFYNEYNILFLNQLQFIGETDKVISLCEKSIKGNYHEVYSIPYYQILVNLYQQRSMPNEALIYRKKIFAYSPSYLLYQEIYNDLATNSQKESFRKELLGRGIRRDSADYAMVLDLKFGLWAETEDWGKILDKLVDYISLLKAEPYLKYLFLFDDALLLKKLLIEIHSSYSYRDNFDDVLEFLKRFITKYYTKDQVSQMDKRNFTSYSSRNIINMILNEYD